MISEILIEPRCPELATLIGKPTTGNFAGHDLLTWQRKTRCELGLDLDRPIIATGHQSLLWHPGILSKYFLVEAVAQQFNWATANLIVDQHAGDYASFEIPIRRRDGSLSVRRLHLAHVRHDLPMGLHEPFTPSPPPTHLPVALPEIQSGLEEIFAACHNHRDAPNAAIQMDRALADMMSRWVSPMPHVTATDLVETTLAQEIMRKMVGDPRQCAACYNQAVAAYPESGIQPLLIRDDYVELPLWRIREDGTRMHAYDHDIENTLAGEASAPVLLPRALMMTALMRLGMCDLFIHGTGGAKYDRAMEKWIHDWLGLEVRPQAVASATVTLDLGQPEQESTDIAETLARARRIWHDPESLQTTLPGPGLTKRRWLEQMTSLPRNSAERSKLFFAMHQQMADLREIHSEIVQDAQQKAELAKRLREEIPIVNRRTWAFPLYPDEEMQALADSILNLVKPCSADA